MWNLKSEERENAILRESRECASENFHFYAHRPIGPSNGSMCIHFKSARLAIFCFSRKWTGELEESEGAAAAAAAEGRSLADKKCLRSETIFPTPLEEEHKKIQSPSPSFSRFPSPSAFLLLCIFVQSIVIAPKPDSSATSAKHCVEKSSCSIYMSTIEEKSENKILTLKSDRYFEKNHESHYKTVDDFSFPFHVHKMRAWEDQIWK